MYMHYFYFTLKVVFLGGEWYICTIFYFYFTLKVIFLGGEWCICTIFYFYFTLKVVFLGGEWCICTSFYLLTKHPNLQRCKCAICISFLHLLLFLGRI